MRTLYYLMDRLDTARDMAATLREFNIDDSGYFIVSKDHDGLRRHSLHDASVFAETDLIHSGLRGAIIGGLCGLLFALWMAVMQPFDMEMGLLTFLLVALLVGHFGAWVGGMVGLSHENYKLTPFHEAIAHGKYLMVVNLRDAARARPLKEVLHRRHPEAHFEAEDSGALSLLSSKPEFRPRHL
ncbi:MAG: hypothetical protein K0Q68_911 [Moraxellaceae bacterium]|jgi:hypothetical protein|nr:hypothetical protein [Moraxellaceae bacterium]